jgi:hypothetical protein
MRPGSIRSMRMGSQWHRSCSVLTAGLLIVLFVACSLLILGVSTHAIELPSVLIRTEMIWIGDLCRATQSSAVQYTQQCAPGYTVDVVVYGQSIHHYTLVQLPTLLR